MVQCVINRQVLKNTSKQVNKLGDETGYEWLLSMYSFFYCVRKTVAKTDKQHRNIRPSATMQTHTGRIFVEFRIWDFSSPVSIYPDFG